MNLDRALRDAAEPVPARVGQAPAQALLDRIVASPGHTTPTAVRSGWRSRKAVVATLVAAVTTAAALILPNLGSSAAYASWTPQPSPLPAADRTEISDRCVTLVRNEYPEAQPGARVVHGEQRGDYAYVSVIQPGWTASCFRDHDGTIRKLSFMVDPAAPATLGAKGIEMQAFGQARTQEGYCRLMTGRVGPDVVGVDLTVRGGDDSRVVHASLEGGYFLAWYPEPADQADTNRTFLTLRLADGTSVEGLSARDLYEAPIVD
jgi:hypothetical protein